MLKRLVTASVLIGALGAATTGQGLDETSLKRLYDARRWFELRDVIEGKPAPPLYMGAVAAAFNRAGEADRLLRRALRESSNPEMVQEAREMLALLYIRLGKFPVASRLIDDLLKAAPQREDIKNAREVFGAYADRPNQTARSRADNVFRCDVTDGVHIPLSVNGKSMTWLLDTGANITMVSEAEARMADVVIMDSSAEAGDLAGGSARIRTARIDRLMIGAAEVRNVPAIVLPDTQQPFVELPAGRRGIIGVPVALALGAIRWSKSGMCETGFRRDAQSARPSNLAFDQFNLLVRTEFDDKPLDFLLDTGNQRETQLWEPFARDFGALIKEHGTAGQKRVSQIGGSNVRDVTILPELRLEIGGLDTVLRSAAVFSKPVGNDFYHGNLGMDLLGRADEVAIDFRSMSIALR
jgi:predicted aspartyl protease